MTDLPTPLPRADARWTELAWVALLCWALLAAGRGEGQSVQAPAPAQGLATPAAVTLTEAITRGQANEPAFAASLAESKAAALDRSIARAVLLPNATYHNQYLFTESNHTPNSLPSASTSSSPRYIANNAVHEYTSQGIVSETLGLGGVAGVERATANSVRAAAELEVARRGLVSAVVGLYFGSLAAERKWTVAQRAADEANAFTDLTTKREAAREAAHADVVKAQLQQQQRQRELADAGLLRDKARLELGMLLFPDPRTAYVLEVPDTVAALPTRAEIEAAASRENPEIRSALASLRLAEVDILSARAAYLPDLDLSFTYGIDAAQFATKARDGSRNLGYSASVGLDIPIWNWLSTQNRIKQSAIRRDAVRTALTAAQKRLLVLLEEDYAEAESVHDQLGSLAESVRTAADSLRLTRLRYTNGEATVLEVVDAQNALTSAENAREDGAVRYQAAIANLQTLTGTY